MKTKNKINILLIKSFIFFIISVLLGFYIKTGLSEYNSILDKYLNFNCILFIQIFTILDFILAACFLIFFIICVTKRKQEVSKKSKIFSNILVVFLVIVNVAAAISIISFQANEDEVVDTIPDSISTYVDFNKVFEISPDDNYFHEQTVFNKVSTEIPVNYNVQQESSDSSIKTSCVEIIDKKLLSEYYDEQEERFSDYNIIEFTDDELNSMGCDKGFYFTSDNYSLEIVVIKGDKLFDVYLFSENIEIDDVIIQQIVAL